MVNEPLFLPKGSIRAVFTLGVVLSVIYSVIMGIALPEWYQTVVATIIAFYFGTRAGETIPVVTDPCTE